MIVKTDIIIKRDINRLNQLSNLVKIILLRLPLGVCRVTVVQARDLKDVDTFNKSDPYCIVKVGSEERKVTL